MDEKVEGKCFCYGVGPQITAAAKSIMPKEAMEHFKASQVELLKGIRHLLDSRIKQMSTPKSHGASIQVD